MLFNSFSFLIFFPAVVIAYYALPHRARVLLLLLVSCFFYMAFVPQYILVLFFLITVDFFLGKAIEKREGSERKMLLLLSVFANLGTLFFFKYFNFFNENVDAIAQFLNWNYSPLILSIALPLGLSFHVFQSLSYVIEVYRRRYGAEKNILTYALYVMFFPQLVAGPIERPGHLIPQFRQEHTFDAERIRSGLERMLWGFFKKIVIADNLASYVNPVYLSPDEHSGLALLLATVFFAFQVYCDFSGYSDIAVGSAKVLGYDLTINFNRPFFSSSIAEFWRRWHISLSNWLRDYVYYPLALRKKGSVRYRIVSAVLITFVLVGLWHGAAWTFVAFGVLHGSFLAVGQLSERWRKKAVSFLGLSQLPKLMLLWKTLTTFALACAGFVFFRAHSLSDAFLIFKGSFYGIGDAISATAASLWSVSAAPIQAVLQGVFEPAGRLHVLAYIAMIAVFVAVEYADSRLDLAKKIHVSPAWFRYALYAFATLALMNLGVTHEIPFIYFQF